MQGCSYMPGLGSVARIRWGSRILLAGWRAAYLQALTGAVVVAGLNMAESLTAVWVKVAQVYFSEMGSGVKIGPPPSLLCHTD